MLDRISLNFYGESHADRVGVKAQGLEGLRFDMRTLEKTMARRRSGAFGTTARRERDDVIFASGVHIDGDIASIVGDIDAYVENHDVKRIDNASVARPSHADLVAYERYGYIPSGGGRFSGRMTAPMCIVGGIAKSVLNDMGIEICAYLSNIGGVECGSYREGNASVHALDSETVSRIENMPVPVLDEKRLDEVMLEIEKAQSQGDSVGGVVECVVGGVKTAMLGDALFDGLEGKIAYCVYAVPGVKGVEFGDGFRLSKMRGSEANDRWNIENGNVFTDTNRSGGINGGISNGMPITLRAAIRPTPSIAKEQTSINLKTGERAIIASTGRNDACIAIRACACIESAVAIALLDEWLKLHN